VNEANVFTNAQAPAISGIALETAVKAYYEIESIIERLSKKINTALLRAIAKISPLKDLKDTKKVSAWIEQLEQILSQDLSPAQKHTVVFNSATNEIEHTLSAYGVDTDVDNLGESFFASTDYTSIKKFAQEIESIITDESFVEKKEKTIKVKNFTEVITFLMNDAKKGQSFQRYKGLGEMNPEQLWETTMNPENRILLKVKIEDAIVADEVFSTLMGDEVEPRRNFIEDNALSVDNLDF
jgi:DNA gyrase subunit B